MENYYDFAREEARLNVSRGVPSVGKTCRFAISLAVLGKKISIGRKRAPEHPKDNDDTRRWRNNLARRLDVPERERERNDRKIRLLFARVLAFDPRIAL